MATLKYYDGSDWQYAAIGKIGPTGPTGPTGGNGNSYTAYRNLIINGAMQVAQRGTSTASITASGYYTADRWRPSIGSMGTWTISQESDGPTGSGLTKSLKFLCTTADASPAGGDTVELQHRLEGQNLQSIKKGTANAEQLTLSFWVKSNVTGTYIAELRDIDNARGVSASYSVASSGTWEKKTIVFPADTTGALDNDNAESFRLGFWLGSGTDFTSGTLATTWASLTSANRAVGVTNLAAATSNYWQITGVQLEVGAVETPFEFKPFAQDLVECQRYLEFSSDYGADYTSGVNSCVIMDMGGAHPLYFPISFNTYKRAAPTMTFYNGNSGATGTWRTNAATDVSISATSISSQGFTTNSSDLGGDGRSSNGTWKAESEL